MHSGGATSGRNKSNSKQHVRDAESIINASDLYSDIIVTGSESSVDRESWDEKSHALAIFEYLDRNQGSGCEREIRHASIMRCTVHARETRSNIRQH